MAFFNPKEDVIEIQLTSHGKHLISEGKFKPEYYSFLDDEVIYDSRYCGLSESQNNAQTRIKENIRTKCQSIFFGIETNVKKVNKLIRSNTIKFADGEKLYQSLDNSYSFPASLGHSQLSSEHAPAWDIVYYNGDITSSIDYITGSYQLLRIPRIDSNIIYETSVDFTDPSGNELSNDVRPISIGENKIYSDGSFIKVEEDYILMEIDERNTDFTNENFQIEVFEKNIHTEGKISGSWTELIPLNFVKRNKNIPPEERILSEEMNIDSRFVEYFFDLLVDEEIDRNIFCESIKKNKGRKNLFVDRLPFDCDDKIEQGNENVFDLPEDTSEECD